MRPLRRLLGVPVSTADRWAIAILLVLPALINLPFAFAGRPLMAGDNLNQNFPLRVLSGELIAHGRLPLWNPDIWSGTPLLAGWNAGAMFPGTWLFAFLPGVAAWEVNVIAVGVIGGLGLHVFLRQQGCSAVASLLGALTFSYTGFMSGQSVHLGLVMGMSFAPWMLLALDHMARTTTIRELLRPAALLGAAGGLVVLAGDPRAISNDAIVTAVFLALIWRDRRSHDGRWRQLLAGAAGGCALAICLSGVQWLPGLSFLHQSQRGSASLAAFGAYSLSGGQLAYPGLTIRLRWKRQSRAPHDQFQSARVHLLGRHPPSCRSLRPWNPLFTRLGSLVSPGCARRGHGSPIEPAAPGPHPAAGVFLALFLLGIVLSLGTTTPLGHLLVRIPLYGGERLQNRNMAIADLALSVLLAMFLDLLGPPVVLRRRLGPRTEEEPGGTQPLSSLSGTQQVVSEVELTRSERLAGMIPPLLVVALVVSIFCATARTERFLGATALALDLPVRMAPYYAFELIVAAVALIVVTRRRWPVLPGAVFSRPEWSVWTW